MVQPNGVLQDKDAVAAFAQQLGMHPSEEAQFGWLAEVGLQSPLPPRWTSHTDEATGYLYYVDHDRQASSWENPLVPYLRRVVEIGRAYLENRTEDFFEEQKGLLWHQHKQDLDCWHGPFSDDQGRSYYVNSTAGVSSWQDPRVDAQYVFELESGLLTSLQEVLPPPLDGEAPGTPGLAGASKPWHTASGAEVLTLDERPGTTKLGNLQQKLTKTMANWSRDNKAEHKSTLEKMSTTAEWLREAQKDEQEVQRLQISKRVAERRRRKLQHGAPPLPSGSPTGAAGGTRKGVSSDALALGAQPLGRLPPPHRDRPAEAPAPPVDSTGQPSPPASSPPSPAGRQADQDKREAFNEAARASMESLAVEMSTTPAMTPEGSEPDSAEVAGAPAVLLPALAEPAGPAAPRRLPPLGNPPSLRC